MTDRNSSRTISSGRPTGLMVAAPQKAKKNAVAGGPTPTTNKRLMRRESIQSLAMAFVLVLGLGFIIIEALADTNSNFIFASKSCVFIEVVLVRGGT